MRMAQIKMKAMEKILDSETFLTTLFVVHFRDGWLNYTHALLICIIKRMKTFGVAGILVNPPS